LVEGFREDFLARFRWIHGHADIMGLLAEADFLPRVSAALAEPFRDAGVTKVAGIETRGFAFGFGVALELGAGFVPVRKAGAIHPGPKAEAMLGADWRGRETPMQIQRAALTPGEAVLVVDDWAETGVKALAARVLIEECGARYVGLSMLVDQLEDDVRARLEPVVAVVRNTELPPNG
jgi:adenine phosphoribosyltransferase